MANPEHLEILKQGVEGWNKWRSENPENSPDLVSADLMGADLIGADLRHANFRGANFGGASLVGVSFSNASLISANLHAANLDRATVGDTVFADIDLRWVKGLTGVLHSRRSESASALSIALKGRSRKYSSAAAACLNPS